MASRQHGLLTRRQLLRLGVAARTVTDWQQRGRLVSMHRGVYRLAGVPVSWEQSLCAALLYLGPYAAASHRSALRLWEMRTIDDVIEVSVPASCRAAPIGVIVHRSVDIDRAAITSIDGVRVTTPIRTLVDAGLVLSERTVGRLTHHAIASGLVSIPETWQLRWDLSRRGRSGVGVMHRILDALPADAGKAESGPEIALTSVLTDAGLPRPSLQHPVVVGGKRFRLDLAYIDEKVAIEYDGRAAHSTLETFDADRVRRNLLTAAGWRVVQVTKEQLASPRQLVETIAHLLAPPNPIGGR